MAAALTCLICSAAGADAPHLRRFSIPSQDLGNALRLLGGAADEQLLFSESLVAGSRSNELHGEYTFSEALVHLIQGSGLRVTRTRSGVTLITAESDPAKPPIVGLEESGPGSGAVVEGRGRGRKDRREESAEKLETVVVTATRQTLDLQDVPLSVVALSSEALEARGIGTIQGLNGTVANLSVMGGTNGVALGTSFSMRGIPRVGFFIDNIWQPYSNGLRDLNLEEAERIEVIRGPQGTLYGRDSTGGAIRVVTKAPGAQFSGKASIAMGSFDRHDVNLVLDVPISQTLRSRISASKLRRDGYVRSTTLDKGLGQVDLAAISGDVLWSPNERLDLRVKYSDSQSHPTDARISLWHIPQGANRVNYEYGVTGLYSLAGAPYDAEHHVAGQSGGLLGQWENAIGDWMPNTQSVAQASIDAKFKIAPGLTLQGWTGYIDFLRKTLTDWDNSNWDAITAYSQERRRFFSQEVQLSGSSRGLEWMTGLFYWNETDNTRSAVWTLQEFRDGRLDRGMTLATPECAVSTARLSCDASFEAYLGIGNRGDTLVESRQAGYAIFGQMVLDLGEKLDVTLGARYYQEDIKTTSLLLVPGESALKPQSIGPFTEGMPFAGTPLVTDDVTFDALTTRVALTYRFGPHLMGYVGYSEGFNSGGAVPLNTDTRRRLVTFDPEGTRAYEVGMRADLLDRHLRLNVTLFQTYWDDIQMRANYVDPETGVYALTFVTQNVAGAEARGVEVEGRWMVSPGFEFNASAGLLSTSYRSFLLGADTPVSSGDDFAQAPGATYSVGVQRSSSLPNGALITGRIDYNYVSGFQRYADPEYHPSALGLTDLLGRYDAGSYGLVNARIVYRPPDPRWELAASVTNLTNEQIVNGGFYGPLWELDWSTVAPPREFGLQLKVFL